VIDLALPLVLGIVGILAVVAAVREWQHARRWRTWPRAEGVIEAREGDRARDHSFRVCVRFRTAEGEEVLGWSANVIGIEASPTVGSSVVVVHDPDRPTLFEARPTVPPAPASMWWWALVAGIVAFVAMILWASWG
jgi:hypothetical protein